MKNHDLRRIKRAALPPLFTSGVLVLASVRLMDFWAVGRGAGQQVVYADRLARGLPTVCKGSPSTPARTLSWATIGRPRRCAEVERMVVSRASFSWLGASTSPSASRSSTHSAATRITSSTVHLRQPCRGPDQCWQAGRGMQCPGQRRPTARRFGPMSPINGAQALRSGPAQPPVGGASAMSSSRAVVGAWRRSAVVALLSAALAAGAAWTA